MRKLFLKLTYNKRRRRKIYESILDNLLTSEDLHKDFYICNKIGNKDFCNYNEIFIVFKEFAYFKEKNNLFWLNYQLFDFTKNYLSSEANEFRILILQTCIEMTK